MVPHEKSLAKRLENKPFVLVGVNGDSEPEELKKGIEQHGITWRSFKDKQDGKRVISDAWKTPGWPTLYLIDQNGIVRKRWTDTVPPEVLNREIDDLIATGAP
jgi:peroxiredoxin